MDSPGTVLRAEREKQKKSLKEISKKLKIKSEYLRAIENDDYSRLPAEVFARAYLRLYAEALGLESDYILSLYKGPPPPEKDVVVKPTPSKKKIALPHFKEIFKKVVPARPSLGTLKPVLTVAAVALVVIAAIMFTKSKEEKTAEEFIKKIEQPGIAEEDKAAEMSLKIIAKELTWVSVSTDGSEPEEWLLRAGESLTVTATEKFTLKIGNAGGTRLIFNGKDMGKLGPRGKVVDIALP